ncbi:hypothetical protein [Metabacillus arenae]|uniref:Uncharacterized protein n=1 Tax=Metabacillus arenae TaxID=2771434 RepID=A0A926NH45_9BACI|nr:hypothetical protein [Metabacillus arenae]MBD1383354.1 hypothetical protein [Metabacillus arenae]
MTKHKNSLTKDRRASGIVVAVGFVLVLLLSVGVSPNKASAACIGSGFVNPGTVVYSEPSTGSTSIWTYSGNEYVRGLIDDHGWVQRDTGGWIQSHDFWTFECEY